MPSIPEILTTVAMQYGVDPITAIATAYHESGLNPRSVGDNGTSFGLYQLHQGGELGNHTADWAFDPGNNARTALSVMGDVTKQHPSWSPGAIAAAAQRPANTAAYATAINNIYNQIKAGKLDLTKTVDVGGPLPGLPDLPNLSDVWRTLLAPFTATDDAMKSGSAAIGRIVNVLSLPNLGIRLFAGFIGMWALIFGVYLFTTGESA